MTTIYPGAARPHETEPGTGQLSRRLLGKTAWSVNPIGIGTWSMGGAWGAIDDGASRQALRVAVAEGVDFFDTADNYGCGHSEVLLGEVLSALGRNKPYVATKIGRRANASDYTLDSFRRWTDASRERLAVDTIDLMQLHCPPPGGLLAASCFRCSRPVGRRGAHTQLWPQRPIGRPRHTSSLLSRRGDLPGGFQCLPPTSCSGAVSRRPRRWCRDHRSGAAGLWALEREVDPRDTLLTRRPPFLQQAW
jgi:hypothetical protein